jgi:hypothetical protein
MKKIYLPLLKEQKQRDVYFSSTLSPYRFEALDTTRHEITKMIASLIIHILTLI